MIPALTTGGLFPSDMHSTGGPHELGSGVRKIDGSRPGGRHRRTRRRDGPDRLDPRPLGSGDHGARRDVLRRAGTGHHRRHRRRPQSELRDGHGGSRLPEHDHDRRWSGGPDRHGIPRRPQGPPLRARVQPPALHARRAAQRCGPERVLPAGHALHRRGGPGGRVHGRTHTRRGDRRDQVPRHGRGVTQHRVRRGRQLRRLRPVLHRPGTAERRARRHGHELAMAVRDARPACPARRRHPPLHARVPAVPAVPGSCRGSERRSHRPRLRQADATGGTDRGPPVRHRGRHPRRRARRCHCGHWRPRGRCAGRPPSGWRRGCPSARRSPCSS